VRNVPKTLAFARAAASKKKRIIVARFLCMLSRVRLKVLRCAAKF